MTWFLREGSSVVRGGGENKGGDGQHAASALPKDPKRDCDTVVRESLIRRREREFELADKIVVLSTFAKATFEAEGVGKAETILPGMDTVLFRPAESRHSHEPFRVCYSGRLAHSST